MRTRAICKAASLLLYAFILSNASSPATAAQAIKDSVGRTRYIVDLVDIGSAEIQGFSEPASKIAFLKNMAAQRIDDIVRIRGIELTSTTSLVGTSFTAYLTDNQVEQIATDRRVSQITPDTYLQASALWQNVTSAYGQVRPWGVDAMGASYAGPSNGIATVYILDTGVEIHADLPGLAPSGRLTALPLTLDTGQPVNPTGCYPHATHIAGIIGAADGWSGSVGILPGVKLVSIAMGESNRGGTTECPPGYPRKDGSIGLGPLGATSVSALLAGLDKVYGLVFTAQKTGIANLSFNMNDGVFAYAGTVAQKMRAVSLPSAPISGGLGYPGALIVQAAGNNNANACDYAYNLPSQSDGIIVVGGLDAYGQRVVPLNTVVINNTSYSFGFRSYPTSRDEPGSNYGACVEMWAPSQRVFSTWANGGYAFLSGTSMAAPHVAGLAARLLENSGGSYNSISLEAAVISHLTTLSASSLVMPRLYSVVETALPTIEIVEGQFDVVSQNYPASSFYSGGINFNKLRSDVSLRFQAIGADGCALDVRRDGAYYSWQTVGTNYQIITNNLPAGRYDWIVTCSNYFFGTTSTLTASGTIRLPVTANWEAKTTSTGFQWQSITGNTPLVTWDYFPPNVDDPFDQRYISENATSCDVQSYGYTGPLIGDPEYPQYSPAFLELYVEQLLWNSVPYGPYPPSYVFGTLYFGDPMNSRYPIAPYVGYKWRVTCTDGYSTAKKVMYGTKR